MASFFDVLSTSILLSQPTSTLSASFVSCQIKNIGDVAGYAFLTITAPDGRTESWDKSTFGLMAVGATGSVGSSGIIQVTGQYKIQSFTYDGVSQSTKVLNDTEFFTVTGSTTTTTTTTTTTGTSILITTNVREAVSNILITTASVTVGNLGTKIGTNNDWIVTAGQTYLVTVTAPGYNSVINQPITPTAAGAFAFLLTVATVSPPSSSPATMPTPTPSLPGEPTPGATVTPTCPAGFHYDTVSQTCVADTATPPPAPSPTPTYGLNTLLPILLLYLVLS